MAITETEIEDAIRRVLLNGETWESGDIKSHLALEKVMALREEVRQSNNDGTTFYLATFQQPVSEND